MRLSETVSYTFEISWFLSEKGSASFEVDGSRSVMNSASDAGIPGAESLEEDLWLALGVGVCCFSSMVTAADAASEPLIETGGEAC